ncbi:MAG: MBL fold metallo-hydrolase [Bacillota bacterium]
MHFAQIYTPGIAQCSYVIGSGKKCVVVDPVRNIEPYLAKAREFNMEIVAILETHLHADFVSGHLELAEKTGAQIYAPQTGNCTFPHHALEDEEEFTVENLRFKMLETPGHTPDCTITLVTDLERGEEPVMVFTGDTLLVGDVGRPDLFPNREEELAESLFSSIKRIKELPDNIEVYPAHGMGSLCGRALSAKLWSTVGTEKRQNYALQHEDLDAFKKDLLTEMPAAPDHFGRCTEINRKGPILLRDTLTTRPFDPKVISEAVKKGGYSVVDIRTFHSFAAAHIPGSYSLSKHGNLPTFAGWLIPPDNKLILVIDPHDDLKKIKDSLHLVGLDNIEGYLDGSIENWINSGFPVNNIETMSVHKLSDLMKKYKVLALDTRAVSEYKGGHIKETVNAPTPDIRHRYKEWDPEKPIVVFCNTSNRSMTAASLLKQNGFKRVLNALGGTNAWAAAGFPMQTGSDER